MNYLMITKRCNVMGIVCVMSGTYNYKSDHFDDFSVTYSSSYAYVEQNMSNTSSILYNTVQN